MVRSVRGRACDSSVQGQPARSRLDGGEWEWRSAAATGGTGRWRRRAASEGCYEGRSEGRPATYPSFGAASDGVGGGVERWPNVPGQEKVAELVSDQARF